MRYWLRKWWWVTILTAAVILVIGWEEKRGQTQTYQCRSTYATELASVPPNQKAAEQQAIKAACEPDGYLYRLFSAANLPTVLLVLIGIGGVWAALKTLAAIKQELVFTQRPRVVVRNFYLSETTGTGAVLRVNDALREGSFCRGQFYIVNTGGSRALIQEFQCELLIERQLPMRRPYEGKIGNQEPKILRPGQSMTWVFGQMEPLPQMTAYNIKENKLGFYVLGWIGYKDDLGIYRETAFCRTYNSDRDCFVPVSDPNYEYAD